MKKFKAQIVNDFEPGSQLFTLYGKQSTNPIHYALDMMGHQTAGKGYYLEREGYHTYLINYTVRGEGHISYEGREYVCREGDLLLLDCDRLHRVQADGGWEFYFLHVTGPALAALYGEIVRIAGNVLHDFDATRLLQSYRALCGELFAHPALTAASVTPDARSCCAISEELYALFNDIWMQCAKRQEGNSHLPESVLRAQAYITKNFARPLTLAEVAAEAFVSPCRLAHLFKRYTGTTVGGLITSLRLQHATELLATTNEKVTVIARACGFSDTQMLKRHMRTLLGLSPTQYRAAVRAGKNFFR